jgi:protein gp37
MILESSILPALTGSLSEVSPGQEPRPMQVWWVRTIRDQCLLHHVPFFFTQWGGFHKKKAGSVLRRQLPPQARIVLAFLNPPDVLGVINRLA